LLAISVHHFLVPAERAFAPDALRALKLYPIAIDRENGPSHPVLIYCDTNPHPVHLATRRSFPVASYMLRAGEQMFPA
jgi:hypothetical protein